MVAGRERLLQKAPQCGAFLLFALYFCLLFPAVASAVCKPLASGSNVKVSHVYDGDTVRLADGRKVRLIGINTPEKGRDGERDEFGAANALQYLSNIIQASDNSLYIVPGVEKNDRYGRILAHLYDRQGRSITELLLREGVGFAIAVPPNLQNLACYKSAETQARNARRGVWNSQSIPAEANKMSGNEAGFYLINGRIGRIGKSRRALWLNLMKGPAIRIDWKDWSKFKGLNPDDLEGNRLEVRGWLYQRKGQQRMQVRHPSAIEWVE